MIATVQGTSAVDAWKRGCELIVHTPGHKVRNLITEIQNPTSVDHGWYSRFDPKSVGATDRLSVVADVLFPKRGRRPGETRPKFYARSAALLQRGLDIGSIHSSWRGTYFQRLISLDGSENQIERAIRALSEWQVRAETALVFHLSSPKSDTIRKRGSPCLQYLEVLWSANGTLDLVAVYRNHDFLNKALGNFIGLGRLLHFLASESGKVSGRLVCHSVRAYADGGLGKLEALTAR
jgi:thymidylate synthase